MPVRTVLERGPKGKKTVAFAVDWPGWSRGAKTPEQSVATLESYRQRYRPIAASAGMAKEFDAAGRLKVSWTLPFLVRHSAYHVMDHAWEMEDKDLSGEAKSLDR